MALIVFDDLNVVLLLQLLAGKSANQKLLGTVLTSRSGGPKGDDHGWKAIKKPALGGFLLSSLLEMVVRVAF
jgi:hypothetical protein